MITVILNRRILDLEIMGGTLVLVRNLATGRKVVGRLRRIQAHAQSNIGIVLICTLRKLDPGYTRNILRRIARSRTAIDNVVPTIRAVAIRDRRCAIVTSIGIGIPFATGKRKVVAIFQVIDVVRRPCGLHKARRTRDRAARCRSRAAAGRVRLGKRTEYVRVHPLSAVRIVPGTSVKVGGALVLVGHGPVRTGKLVVLHPAEPRGGIVTHATIAIGVHRTPFRNEYGKSAVHGTHGIRALITGGMRTRIEMERVGDVILGVRNLVTDGIARILIPTAVAHDNQVIGILADSRDDRIGIGLDGAPGLRSGLVENLEDDVIVLAPFLRHVAEELLGIVDIVRCLVAMVVDNHVDIVVDGGLHHSVHQALVVAFLGEVVAGAPVLVHAHRRTDNLDVLLLHEPAHDIGCPERRTDIARNAPEEAHALYRNFVTAGNALAGTVNLALSAGILARLELSVLAYGPHAPERHDRKGGHQQQREFLHKHPHTGSPKPIPNLDFTPHFST